MKLYILAAGTGSRLLPLTKNTPKSLIDLGDGSSLLEKQLNEAIESEIFDNVTILTGYRHEQIEAKINDYRKSIAISTIYNPFYNSSNNLVSIWLASHLLLGEDFAITNGDNMYEQGVFRKVYSEIKRDGIYVTINEKDHYDEDDMKVILNDESGVEMIHKEIPLDRVNAESVGLSFVVGEKNRTLFVNALNSLVVSKENLQLYWLIAFNYLVQNGVSVKPIKINREDWREIDFHPDLKSLRQLILKDI